MFFQSDCLSNNVWESTSFPTLGIIRLLLLVKQIDMKWSLPMVLIACL